MVDELAVNLAQPVDEAQLPPWVRCKEWITPPTVSTNKPPRTKQWQIWRLKDITAFLAASSLGVQAMECDGAAFGATEIRLCLCPSSTS